MESSQRNFRKRLSIEESSHRIRRYCAYQERSHQEVRNKLYEFGLDGDSVEELLSLLISEGFINEERFAKAYAGGKFRIKKWGRLKIQMELEHHGLTAACIASGIREIDPADYLKTLKSLISKKTDQTLITDRFILRNKVAKYAIAKGFEPDLVWDTIKELLPEKRTKK